MAGGGNAIRGSRVGAGPMGEAERGEARPAGAHLLLVRQRPRDAAELRRRARLRPRSTWDCPRCGLPAGRDQDNPPPPPKIEPYKTHLAYVKERRSDADGARHPRRGPGHRCASAASSSRSRPPRSGRQRSEFQPVRPGPVVHSRLRAPPHRRRRRPCSRMAESEPARRRQQVAQSADRFGGVLPRTALRGLGADRHVIAREVADDRWAIHGAQTVAVHTRPLEAPARWWRAVWETGSGWRLSTGSAPSGRRRHGLRRAGRTCVGTGRLQPEADAGCADPPRRQAGRELMTDRGVPRVRPALAAVRAAHSAVSDRQAALVLVLPIQQGIVSGPQLRAATSMWSGRRRRALVPQLVQDITDGATSLGELDFARMCRVRGLPEPDRQVVRRTPRGRVYLDARWDAHDSSSRSTAPITARV